MVDKSNIANLATVINTAIDTRVLELHTSQPGIIESFDPATQLATVQPAIRRIFVTDDGERELLTPTAIAILINVPVVFPRGGGFSLTFPVSPGDECLLVFNERGYDNWVENGGVVNPTSARTHDLSDAVCYVGLSSKPNAIPDFDAVNCQLKSDNGDVSITLSNSQLTINTSGDTVINASANVAIDCIDANITASGDVNAECENLFTDANTLIDLTAPIINLNGAVNCSGLLSANASFSVTGSATGNGVNIGDTHVHMQGPDSDGDIQVNTGPPQ